MEIISKILITGATGYIGRNLLKRFINSNNVEISIITRNKSNLKFIDSFKDKITIYLYDSSYESIENIFKNNKFDYVFHLASFSKFKYHSLELSEIIDSNIKFGTYILEAMSKYGSKFFINTSSYWQNYRSFKSEPICLYAATKQGFEDIINYYSLDKNIKAISLKLYDVYGYEDNRNKFINTLITHNLELIDVTKGEQLLSLVFIDDVVDAYFHSMKLILNTKHNHSIYGVYSNEKISIKEIIKKIKKILHKEFKVNFGVVEYNNLQIMDPYFEKKLPGWSAKVTFSKGLKIIKNLNEKK